MFTFRIVRLSCVRFSLTPTLFTKKNDTFLKKFEKDSESSMSKLFFSCVNLLGMQRVILGIELFAV